jgi:release factor glutamine methyltransferase
MATIKELLGQARLRLASAGIAAPALDARLLLQHATGITAAEIVGQQDETLTGGAENAFRLLVERRVLREPVAKIIGRKEFYGREFEVSRAVLDPRPDSESLIELCLDIIDTQAVTKVLDLGTGSGCLLLTLLAERQHLSGTGVDISEEALRIAGCNGRALGLERRATLQLGEWFQPTEERFELILSNPPYIETAAIDGLQPEVSLHDPRLALDGGPDGLDAYRAIAGGAAAHLLPDGHVAVEVGEGQAAGVVQMFRQSGFEATGQRRDLSGRPRALAFQVI